MAVSEDDFVIDIGSGTFPPDAWGTFSDVGIQYILIKDISSIGNKSPDTLGLEDGDIILVSNTNHSSDVNKVVPESTPRTKVTNYSARKKNKNSKRKVSSSSYDIAEDEKLRRYHSKALSRVFDEAETTHFKNIRQRLNGLKMERTKPKVKKACLKIVPLESSISLPPDELGEDKALKTEFIVHIGEVQNLYKSTKPSKRRNLTRRDNITLDLHGMTKDVALKTLDEQLPKWVDVAMHGEHPWVIPVVIICGKGSQTLSEAVEGWIKSNDKVANAPKNLLL